MSYRITEDAHYCISLKMDITVTVWCDKMQSVYWQLATVMMAASLPSVRDWPVSKSP